MSPRTLSVALFVLLVPPAAAPPIGPAPAAAAPLPAPPPVTPELLAGACWRYEWGEMRDG